MLKEIETHWNWIAGDPTASITVMMLSAGIGFAVSQFLSKTAMTQREERLINYKEQVEKKNTEIKALQEQITRSGAMSPASASAPTQPTYPEHGFHGVNILSPLVAEVNRGSRYSMHVLVPQGQRLKVRLQQVSGTASPGEMGAWFYQIPPRNWQSQQYNQDRSEQLFEAASGEADLSISFERCGEVSIEVFADGGHAPIWTKTLGIR